MNIKSNISIVPSSGEKGKRSVLPNSYSLALICAICCFHVAQHSSNTSNVHSAGILRENSVTTACVRTFGSVFPFCLSDMNEDGLVEMLSAAALFACLCLRFVVVDWKSEFGDISKKGELSVLPNSRSLALICAILCGHVAQHLRNSFGMQSAGTFSSRDMRTACVGKPWPVFRFLLPDTSNMDLSDVMIEVLAAAVIGALALGVVAMTANHLMQSARHVYKSKQSSVLPNFHSSMIACGVFCTHAVYNLRRTYGVQGTSGQSGVDNKCVAKFGSEFPFCLPEGHSATMSKVFPAVVLGFITLLVAAMAAQNLVQSYSSIEKKDHISVLPNFHSLLLGCSIFCAHLFYNAQAASGILDSASVSVIGSIVSVMVVRTVVQQSTNTNTKGKNSVIPNAYSFFMICCICFAHCARNFTGVHGIQVAIVDYVTSASILEGIVQAVPFIAVLIFSVVVLALRLQLNSSDKRRQRSVLPGTHSVMLICCALCAHTVHNQPDNSHILSSPSSFSPILGASSGMIPFGHKDNGSEDIALNISDSILANRLDKRNLDNAAKTSATSTDTYPARRSGVISDASPKAIFASVLFALIGMMLKLGSKSNDKKGNQSLLPNFRSVLLICFILFGHAVHNWSYTYSEHNSQISIYTGVDKAAAWDDYGAVLPDSAEDLDHLLEISPDPFDQPSDMLTLR